MGKGLRILSRAIYLEANEITNSEIGGCRVFQSQNVGRGRACVIIIHVVLSAPIIGSSNSAIKSIGLAHVISGADTYAG